MRISRGAAAVGATLLVSIVLAASVPASAGVPAMLRAEYTFDVVNDGIVDDLSGRGHALTLSGNYSSADGLATPAVAFAPVSRAATPHVANLNPVRREFAVSVVFRIADDISALTDTPNMVQKGFFNDPGQWKMQLQPDIAAVQCRIKGTVSAQLLTSSVTEVDDGLWHTATCWRAGAWVGVTVDGVDVSVNQAVGDVANGRPMLIGAKSLSSITDQFTGEIDYVALAIGQGAATTSRQSIVEP